MLDEMERHLLKHDADVVSAPSGDRALSYRNLVYGALLLLAGVGGLVAAVVASGGIGQIGSIVIGVIAFVAMLGGAIVAFTPVRRASSGVRPGAGPRPDRQRDASFMERMNDRWDRRQDER
ncbi:hypothetical protein GCM10022383_23070 [Microbacterium soli]|uniref:DUF3040 domain-containing protein n=2 Tax=Microbacterium soli TaxID=446075 RepID=A0ABP7NEB0_9MICO